MGHEELVVLDTDVVIDFFSGAKPQIGIVAGLLAAGRVALTSLTAFELASGARTPRQLEDLDLLLEVGQVVELDARSALRAAVVYRSLRERAQLLDTPDLLIAGCCLSRDLPLYTRNHKHFSRVEDLVLWSP